MLIPRYTIQLTDKPRSCVHMIAADTAAVLHMMSRLHLIDADVLEDGKYVFSVCASDGGFWTIVQRDALDTPERDGELC